MVFKIVYKYVIFYRFSDQYTYSTKENENVCRCVINTLLCVLKIKKKKDFLIIYKK